jgi:hypothetical protein
MVLSFWRVQLTCTNRKRPFACVPPSSMPLAIRPAPPHVCVSRSPAYCWVAWRHHKSISIDSVMQCSNIDWNISTAIYYQFDAVLNRRTRTTEFCNDKGTLFESPNLKTFDIHCCICVLYLLVINCYNAVYVPRNVQSKTIVLFLFSTDTVNGLSSFSDEHRLKLRVCKAKFWVGWW